MDHSPHNSVIRDCILDNRLIDTPRYIRGIIDAPEFQRLRQIRQTGLTSYVFPTAEHSRFSHSIGAYGTAQMFFDHISRRSVGHDIKIPPLKFDKETRKEFCVAALLHDIGHTAFSHVLESDLLPAEFRSHEECTEALIIGETEIAKQIEKAMVDRAAVYQLVAKKHPNRALNDLISSTFDIDRCDYVLRDGLLTGVKASVYDLSWLIHSLSIGFNEHRIPVLVLDGPRGIDSLRQFLYARRYLYRKVYYHAAIRGAQVLVKAIFSRMGSLPASKQAPDLCPPPLRSLIDGKRPSLGNFLKTTDIEIWAMIKSYADSHPDDVIKYMCSSFCQRHFPKPVIDSERVRIDLNSAYRIDFSSTIQMFLPLSIDGEEPHITSRADFISDITEISRRELEKEGIPSEVADYLVAFDKLSFGTPPPELQFHYNDKEYSFSELQGTRAGRDLSRLLETFSITRVYVPFEAKKAIKEHISIKYGSE